jgi:hypothetical protein
LRGATDRREADAAPLRGEEDVMDNNVVRRRSVDPVEGAAAVALIEQKAGTVRATSDRLVAAIDEERGAEGELLLAAVNAARPSLEVLSSRIPVTFDGTVAGQPEVDYFNYAGIALAEDVDDLSDEERETGAVARVLYLLENGNFAEVTYFGNAWPMARGAKVAGSLAFIGDRDGQEINAAARTVIEEWDLKAILSGLIDKLDRAEHGRVHKRTAEASTRAAQLRALVTLLPK